MSCSVVKQVGLRCQHYKHRMTLHNIHVLWRCWCRYRFLMFVCLVLCSRKFRKVGFKIGDFVPTHTFTSHPKQAASQSISAHAFHSVHPVQCCHSISFYWSFCYLLFSCILFPFFLSVCRSLWKLRLLQQKTCVSDKTGHARRRWRSTEAVS